MRSMQCNVEFGYQLSIRSGTKENHGKAFYVKLNSIGLSVSHRKHTCITCPLRTQQVNAVYRFVTMVY
jgi:hypothetical protein